MRLRVVLATFLAALLGALVLSVPAGRAALAGIGSHARSAVGAAGPPYRSTAQLAPPLPVLKAAPVTITARTTFFGWALLDRKSGQITGSDNAKTGTTSTESMVKAWIVADYLRTHPDTGDDTLSELRQAIVDSNDDAAQKYYQLGGSNAVIQRLISTCGLTRTTIGRSGWWSYTMMTPQDAVAYGECLANGAAAGPKWTTWLLKTMRDVQGTVEDQVADQRTGGGRWGIIDTLPWDLAPDTSIKNGWTYLFADGTWHVNCLAVHQDFVLAVMVRYPAANSIAGLRIGDGVCQSVTSQLTYAPTL